MISTIRNGYIPEQLQHPILPLFPCSSHHLVKVVGTLQSLRLLLCVPTMSFRAARTKRGKTCPVHRRDTPISSQRVLHHSPQHRSQNLRSSTTHSYHTKQETHSLPAATATPSPPCALSTCEHRRLPAFRTRLLAHTLGHFQFLGLAHHSREVPSQSIV